MLDKIIPYEKDLFFLINSSHNYFLDCMMWLFSSIKTWSPLIIVIIFHVVYKRSWQQWLPVLIAIILVFVLSDQFSSHIMKPLIVRPRPSYYPGIMEYVRIVNDYRGGGVYGFVSGDTSNSFGFAILSTLLFKNRIYSIVVFIWATIMAYSRIYLGVHFVSDIIGGMTAGILIGYCVYRLYYFVAKKLSQKDIRYLPPGYSVYHTNILSLVIIGYTLLLALFSTIIVS